MTRVLIVDDHLPFRAQLRRLLTHAGLTVVGEAGDIADAEAQVQTWQPDLAVVDVMLPDVSGLEGTSRLKALLPTLRVILISAHVDEDGALRRAAIEAGAEAFVAKDDLGWEVVRMWAK